MPLLFSRACLTLVLASAALFTACDGGTPSPATGGVETVVDTVAGVEHVRNSGTAAELFASPVIRIGAESGGPDEFGRIRSVVADGDGNIYVADVISHEIRVFAPDGSHLRTIGRQGSGPGEFQSLYSLAWVGGNLAALDPGNARITVFTREGEWVRDTRHYPLTGGAMFVRLYPLGDEGFYSRVLDAERQRMPLVRTVATGDIDTLVTPEIPPGGNRGAAVCHRPDGAITSVVLPQSAGLEFAFPVEGARMVVARTGSYSIATTDAAGDTLRVTIRERAPIPYPDSLWEEGVKPLNELRERFPGLRCDPASLERPEYRAALRHIMFDETGNMWVEAASETGFVWDVFDPSGRLLGTVPRRNGPRESRPTSAAGGSTRWKRVNWAFSGSRSTRWAAASRVGSEGSLPTGVADAPLKHSLHLAQIVYKRSGRIY